MKLILSLTFAANLFLFGALLLPRGTLPEGIVPFAAPSPRAPAPIPSAPAPAPAPPTPSPVFLRGLDAAELARSLRDAGLSDALTRAIVGAKLRLPIMARRQEALPPRMAQNPAAREVPYWQSPSAIARPSPEDFAEIRKMQRSVIETLNTLFGPAPASPLNVTVFGNFPAEKVEALQEITRDYNEMVAAVRNPAGIALGAMIRLPGDDEAIAFLEAQRERDLQALLSADEYEEYTFRTSVSGNRLRNLFDFSLTESEFRAMFPLQREFDLRFPGPLAAGGAAALNNPAERLAATQQLNAALKATLSPERAVEFERASDPAYRTIRNTLDPLGTPPQAAAAVWDLQKSYQARATQIRSTPMPQPERFEKLSALQAEAKEKLAGAIGDRQAAETYQAGAAWVRNLAPPALPAGRGGQP